MADSNEDKTLSNFFESLLDDPTEKQVVRLILEGKDVGIIIEEIMKPSDEQKKSADAKHRNRL